MLRLLHKIRSVIISFCAVTRDVFTGEYNKSWSLESKWRREWKSGGKRCEISQEEAMSLANIVCKYYELPRVNMFFGGEVDLFSSGLYISKGYDAVKEQVLTTAEIHLKNRKRIDVIDLLHELSHHIFYCRGYSGTPHGEDFLIIEESLLKSAERFIK